MAAPLLLGHSCSHSLHATVSRRGAEATTHTSHVPAAGLAPSPLLASCLRALCSVLSAQRRALSQKVRENPSNVPSQQGLQRSAGTGTMSRLQRGAHLHGGSPCQSMQQRHGHAIH